MKKNIIQLVCLFFLANALNSCKSPKIIMESTKDINGTWRLERILRNSEDMTMRVDTTGFQLTFQTYPTPEYGIMGTYEFLNGAPFVVQESGTWSFDDPRYPFTLLLREDKNVTSVPVQFYFPAKEGKNQIQLLFTPGCTSNKYEYFLKRIN